jgi:hypothetical protein
MAIAEMASPIERIRLVKEFDGTKPATRGQLRVLTDAAKRVMPHGVVSFDDLTPEQAMTMLDGFDDFLGTYYETTDGTPLLAALDALSLDEYFSLFKRLMTMGGTSLVPTVRPSESNGSRSASKKNRRGG